MCRLIGSSSAPCDNPQHSSLLAAPAVTVAPAESSLPPPASDGSGAHDAEMMDLDVPAISVTSEGSTESAAMTPQHKAGLAVKAETQQQTSFPAAIDFFAGTYAHVRASLSHNSIYLCIAHFEALASAKLPGMYVSM